MQPTSEHVIFAGGFESGAGIFRDGEHIYRVPSCTHWDDDHLRVIARDGEAVLQLERRESRGCRSWGTGEWSDIRSLGPVAELKVVEDHPRGCCCDDC